MIWFSKTFICPHNKPHMLYILPSIFWKWIICESSSDIWDTSKAACCCCCPPLCPPLRRGHNNYTGKLTREVRVDVLLSSTLPRNGKNTEWRIFLKTHGHSTWWLYLLLVTANFRFMSNTTIIRCFTITKSSSIYCHRNLPCTLTANLTININIKCYARVLTVGDHQLVLKATWTWLKKCRSWLAAISTRRSNGSITPYL